MSQILDTDGTRPGLGTRLTAHTAVAAARLLAHLPPRRIRTVLGLARRGARPARYDEALRARRDVTAVSTLCSGRYCLPTDKTATNGTGPGHRRAPQPG